MSILILMLQAVAAIDPGVATGTLNVKGESTELKHAYAFLCDNAEGMLDGPELRILVADRELPDDIIAGWNGSMRLQPLVKDGRLRGILLKLDPKDPAAALNGTLLYPPANPLASLLFFSSKGNNEIRKFQMANNRVVGEAQYELTKGESDGDVPGFKFAFSFSAPLFHDQAVTAKLSGPPAVRSAPAQALLAFERAVRAGNLDLARGLVTSTKWREIEAHRAQAGETAFKQMVKQVIPVSAERARQIKQVIIRTSRAVVLLNEGGGKTAISLVEEQGKWKVD